MIRDYQQLFEAAVPDFAPIYEGLNLQDMLAADSLLPGEMNLAPRIT